MSTSAPSILPVASLAAVCLFAAPAFAQTDRQPDSSQSEQVNHLHHQDQHLLNGEDHELPLMREASGTTWQPDETPSYAAHRQAGTWMLMAHGNAFLHYIVDGSTRGDGQVGSVNWVMGDAERRVGAGRLRLRGMISLEPWTIPGCGYPDLLATGEECQGEVIHDRQHPHDLFMEMSATYDRRLTRRLSVQVYGGPVGEPALGPVAFPHRLSAMPNLVAPITHHWFDATHVSFGVVTAAAYGESWKAETSLFNGREPDEQRTDFDFGPLDSWSGRFWFLPTPRWALQVSAGRLNGAEAGHDGAPPTDITRVTASATYHRRSRSAISAATVGWAQNRDSWSGATGAWLAEGSLTIDDRDVWFGRFELSQKSGRDLGLDVDDVVDVAKMQAGYTRFLGSWHGLKPGVGASVSGSILPDRLTPAYGGHFAAGVAVFITLRPAERPAGPSVHASGASAMPGGAGGAGGE
jgi:hypothetical protein